MSGQRIYLDHHATTPMDPRVLEAMLPYFTEEFGNAGSTSHSFGWNAKEAVDQARRTIAGCLGASEREIVFTSGATESNNLALKGASARRARRGKHVVSVRTEHRSVLDPLEQLKLDGWEVTLLDVEPACSDRAGVLDPERVRAALRDDTALVSVMLANNEVGVIQPLAEISRICRERGAWLHTDATQAVGKIPVDVDELGVDLMSFTAHKLYGPKGAGGLYVRRRDPQVRLSAQIHGGGQEGNLRSGTLNVPGIVGLARALALCVENMAEEAVRLRAQRQRLWDGVTRQLADVRLNGPALEPPTLRLAGNLNLSFAGVDGEALLMNLKDLAVSSGSACTSANPEPSHVLLAMGLDEDLTRASLRFGLGRFNSESDIDRAVSAVVEVVNRLRKLSSLA
jgi:cysteine desulfurase